MYSVRLLYNSPVRSAHRNYSEPWNFRCIPHCERIFPGRIPVAYKLNFPHEEVARPSQYGVTWSGKTEVVLVVRWSFLSGKLESARNVVLLRVICSFEFYFASSPTPQSSRERARQISARRDGNYFSFRWAAVISAQKNTNPRHKVSLVRSSLRSYNYFQS